MDSDRSESKTKFVKQAMVRGGGENFYNNYGGMRGGGDFGEDDDDDERGRRERGGCDAIQKEYKEMTKVLSKIFMRMMISEPDDMTEFSFLPLSLLTSVQNAVQAMTTDNDPELCDPWKEAFWMSELMNSSIGEPL